MFMFLGVVWHKMPRRLVGRGMLMQEPVLNVYDCHLRLQTFANDQDQEVRSKKQGSQKTSYFPDPWK